MIGALRLFSLINVAVAIPVTDEKLTGSILAIIELAVCIAFANALLFDGSLQARKMLLYVFIIQTITTFLYSLFKEFELASPGNLK